MAQPNARLIRPSPPLTDPLPITRPAIAPGFFVRFTIANDSQLQPRMGIVLAFADSQLQLHLKVNNNPN